MTAGFAGKPGTFFRPFVKTPVPGRRGTGGSPQIPSPHFLHIHFPSIIPSAGLSGFDRPPAERTPEENDSLKNKSIRTAALILSVLLISLIASAIPSSATGTGYRRRHTATPRYQDLITPVPIPYVTPTPSPEAAGTLSSSPDKGFSFGYAEIPAGLEAYQSPDDPEPAGFFRDSCSVCAVPAGNGWIALAFINAVTQQTTEVYVPAGTVTELHATAADALRARLAKYHPSYYHGFPLPTVFFDLAADQPQDGFLGGQTAAPQTEPPAAAPAGTPLPEDVPSTPGPAADETAETPSPEDRPAPEGTAAQEQTVPPETMPAQQADEHQDGKTDAGPEHEQSSLPWHTAVTNVEARQTGVCQALITWQGNGVAALHAVYRLDSDGSQTFVDYTEEPGSFITPELEDGEYSFIVRPCREENGILLNGQASRPASVTIKAITWKTAPTNVRAETVGRDVTISWTGNGIVEQHTVYMASRNSVLTFAGKTENGESELTIHDLPDGKYLFLVRPRRIIDDIVRHGDASVSVSAAVPAVLWSTAVTGVKASVTEDERSAVVLTWRGNGKASRYSVFEATEAGDVLVGSAEHSVTCILTGVSGEAHRYFVRPCRLTDGQTELGEPSEQVTADLSEVWRTAPWEAVATVNSQSITLTWSGSRLTDEWDVFELTDSGLETLQRTAERQAVLTNVPDGGHIYQVFPVRGEGDGAEYGDPSAELFTVSGSHRAFGRTENGLIWTVDDDGTLTLYGSGQMEDFSAETPPPWTEYREQITEAVLEQGLTSVGAGAFENCPLLSSAAFPDGLETIGAGAFKNCPSLTSVSFPRTLTEIRNEGFSQSGLLSADLPEALTALGDRAFSGCAQLASVTLPDTVAYIGEYAFFDCPSLQKVVSY